MGGRDRRAQRKKLQPDASSGRWYLFLDEGGDLNFKGNGSRFFTVSSLATRRPFELAGVLADLRFDVIEEGLDIEYVHASES